MGGLRSSGVTVFAGDDTGLGRLTVARSLAAAMLVSVMLAAPIGLGCSSKPLLPARTVSGTEPAITPPANLSSIPSDVGKDDSANLTGAGATFPGPLDTRWVSDYKTGVARGVEVNYQAIGSGGGIQQITQGTVDFGASDAPMTDTEMEKAAGIQHIPTVLGAIVITYNLPNISQPLLLDGDTIAKIYLGTIKNWDDPAIASQNPGVSLPADDIVVIHRSDGSGTSYVFTDYLTHVSADWKAKVGTSKNPQWPKGIGGQGNDGVTQQVKQNRNSIGYVELIFADTNHLPMAQLKDRAGDYVTASTASASLAASGITLPEDYRVSIVDSPAKGAYPIASFTYILLYRDQPDAKKGNALVDLLWWATHDGQKTAPELDYAPLPAEAVRAIELTLATRITSHGQPLLVAP